MPQSPAILAPVSLPTPGIVFAITALTGCSLLPGQEAPDACGFPDETALSYAGRSTTAALGVQAEAGDVMSDDLADIYITRDQFDRGELRGPAPSS
jgi:hypothetical protein